MESPAVIPASMYDLPILHRPESKLEDLHTPAIFGSDQLVGNMTHAKHITAAKNITS